MLQTAPDDHNNISQKPPEENIRLKVVNEFSSQTSTTASYTGKYFCCFWHHHHHQTTYTLGTRISLDGILAVTHRSSAEECSFGECCSGCTEV
jgi:hypothetical protein